MVFVCHIIFKKLITMTRPEKERYAVGVDIGGSHVCSAVVDLTTGSICAEPVTTAVNCHAGASEIVGAWAENILQTVAASDLGTITQVGFAFPGPFDYQRGISLIRGVCKFDRIFGLDVAESLRTRLKEAGIGTFRFVNDASAFALGECLGGAGRGVDRVVALTLGTGVGSGFVDQCRLVESSDEVPANGWVYCLPFEEGIVDDAFSTRWVCRRYRELTSKQVEGVREVAANYDTDPAARQLFEEYGERFAQFAGTVVPRFRGDVLILGGNISKAYSLFEPALTRTLKASGQHINIRTSELLDRAAMIGAASLFL